MLAPYYAQDGITIYHGDCRDVLSTLPRGSVDLLLTDPPYGVSWQSGRRAESFAVLAGDDSAVAALEGVQCALLALKRGRHVYIFGRYDLSALPLSRSVELVWDKEHRNGGDLTLPWGNQHEYIQFAVYNISQANRADGAGRLAARLRQGSVLRCPRPNGSAVIHHPTEKPVMLLRQLIESSSIMGETVLDPFMGVGSTLVAAQLEGRRAIGIELEERYCEIAANRLRQTVLPLEVGA